MTTHPRGPGRVAPAVLLAALCGCAASRYARMSPPAERSALGLPFGADRAAVERALGAASVASHPDPADPDALVAERCPVAPVAAPCHLAFGPEGLYEAQLEVPEREAGALVRAVEEGLGPADAGGDRARAAEDVAALVASWRRAGWTVTIAKAPPAAVLRVAHDAAAPPVVAGVPLGRPRGEVEAMLERQGATVVQRDPSATTYLGCPRGAADARSCVVHYKSGRAEAVIEVLAAAGDDGGALKAWRDLARRYERDVGRAPRTECPDAGPDRVGGDCTATWASERLVLVVGAHRSAGARHRGAISVYTAFTYAPLSAQPAEAEEEDLEAR